MDNEAVLILLEQWSLGIKLPAPWKMAEKDAAVHMLNRVRCQTGKSSFFKVKSHRAEPFNTRADEDADLSVHCEQIVGHRVGSHHIVCTIPGYKGVWNVKVNKHSQHHASLRVMHLIPPGKTVSFLKRANMGRHLMGKWWSKWNGLMEHNQTLAIQMVTRMFPSPMQLYTHGLSSSSRCVGSGCGAMFATLEHIQCIRLSVKEARIAAHHRIWLSVFGYIKKCPGRGEHWSEETIEDMCDHVHRLAGITLPDMLPTSFYDPKKKEHRTITWEELRAERPDGHSIIKSKKLVLVHENTRGSDTVDTFVDQLQTFEQDWYQQWVHHLRLHLEPKGWKLVQLDWITGFRGSIPVVLWTNNLEQLNLQPALWTPLLQQVFEDLMEGGVEVLMAYTANQRTQIAWYSQH